MLAHAGVGDGAHKAEQDTNGEGHAQFAYRIAGDAGVGNWNCMRGQRASSTRMELAAWINASTYKLPVHMVTDSKSMMDKANVMTKAACTWNDDNGATWWIKRNLFLEAWALQPDGDLWGLVWEADLQGYAGTTLDQGQGHAIDKQVESGGVEAQHKRGEWEG